MANTLEQLKKQLAQDQTRQAEIIGNAPPQEPETKDEPMTSPPSSPDAVKESKPATKPKRKDRGSNRQKQEPDSDKGLVQVWIDKDVKKKLQMYCLQNDVKLTDLLRDYLDNLAKKI